jgi:hypothetical protein
MLQDLQGSFQAPHLPSIPGALLIPKPLLTSGASQKGGYVGIMVGTNSTCPPYRAGLPGLINLIPRNWHTTIFFCSFSKLFDCWIKLKKPIYQRLAICKNSRILFF